MRLRWTAVATAAVLATGCGGDGGEEAAAGQSYYLSLGDSLSVGVQPGENGESVETSEGYTDILHRTLYDSDSTLRHERLGCGGEDTTTFISGGLPACDERYEEGSQLEEAEAFLDEHAERVELVTLTIGANNLTDCVEGVRAPDARAEKPEDIGVDEACVTDGLERVRTELPVIAERLREAAGPDTQIVAMTYYNPFLALHLLDDEPSEEEAGDTAADGEVDAETTRGDALAERAATALAEVNESLTSIYAESGIDVADVDAAFESTNDEVPSDSETGMPTNVQNVCDHTWMCDTERGPDIHTNRSGAQEIAGVFAEQVH